MATDREENLMGFWSSSEEGEYEDVFGMPHAGKMIDENHIQRLDLSYAELSDRIGYSPSAVSSTVRGVVSIENGCAEAICEELDLDYEFYCRYQELFVEENDKIWLTE